MRNVAIVAHVDHGKTTLVDKLLQQSGTFDERHEMQERVMDSNALEQERGITILSKNTAINWTNPETGETFRINIVDTPGHADFGGEVERVLSMVDCVLLLVDSVDGPMPQTRFVTMKAFQQGLKPILVINKIDKPGARPDWVESQVFDLFDRLGASDEQLDFKTVYASGILGKAGHSPEELAEDLTPLFNTIIDRVEPPKVDEDGPLQMQISSLDYSSYVGVLGIGRIARGKIRRNMPVTVIDREGNKRNAKVLQVMGYLGLERQEKEEASAGDIVCISGIEKLNISDTVCDQSAPEALPPLSVDEPTVTMTFHVNNSPFAGREGKYVTSRQINDRLQKELLHNVALRVEQTEDPDKFRVSGRGELHLSVLIETMRREGFELGVSRPEVINREIDGVMCEPVEDLIIDCEEEHQGGIMEELGIRKGELKDMVVDGSGRIRLTYEIPSRGLIGFRSLFMTLTSGSGVLNHSFSHYGPKKDGKIGSREKGVLISMADGKAMGFALFNLQDRGRLMISPGIEVYEGMVIGIHSRGNDLVVNPLKEKALTNMRASGTDENIILTPPIKHTLESALEFLNDDELLEVTPENIRIRKKFLKENDRKRIARSGG
ncbi:MAG: translational GTPase TypA [Gammaproteobacteria bacterium]|nr:translational GTPase TypA [Gammaproteobacteria bacterium]|tara:strand:- start:70923 stop:72746 length:1824 start_codon:yes stop_codon:yes gene_type:complete